ncbi:hypothetical protein EX30DRAFT_321253 [Ascodesmis nigricans]|uniref:Uncharacterized protein n=1 Tax=Ascodesmis nigricans TaxID=341454 RepID=A0A4S2MT53_9PEZI|nr:hypothetical protein EX30DRAFT_321253 [Ascodesmis nigricans]
MANRRHRYQRIPESPMENHDDTSNKGDVPGTTYEDLVAPPEPVKWYHHWNKRDHYPGALIFNIFTFLLPAIYGTLSKLYIANIDSSMVATTDTYTYISVVVEVINEGLPRAAYRVIGDKSRQGLPSRFRIATALIAFQSFLGAIMSVIICAAAANFADAFVPKETRAESLLYVRIAAFSAFFSAVDVAVAISTRTLDRPEVPLAISMVKTAVNILLDFVLLSKFRPNKKIDVDAVTQVIIRLSCDAMGALVGILYFLWIAKEKGCLGTPKFAGLKKLVRPGSYTFVESAVRNAFYLWLVSGIVGLGQDYATAWGVFNTIRWGIVMVPVYALEATASTFVGHEWGAWKARSFGIKATKQDLKIISWPALVSVGIALVVEIPLCFGMGFGGARRFAYYLSNSEAVSKITAHMWRTIDWCYIFYAVTTQLASILLATRPRWYLAQSLVANIFWVLPWAIVVTKVKPKKDPWLLYGMVFGGSMVASFIIVMGVLTLWARRLMKAPKSQVVGVAE